MDEHTEHLVWAFFETLRENISSPTNYVALLEKLGRQRELREHVFRIFRLTYDRFRRYGGVRPAGTLPHVAGEHSTWEEFEAALDLLACGGLEERDAFDLLADIIGRGSALQRKWRTKVLCRELGGGVDFRLLKEVLELDLSVPLAKVAEKVDVGDLPDRVLLEPFVRGVRCFLGEFEGRICIVPQRFAEHMTAPRVEAFFQAGLAGYVFDGILTTGSAERTYADCALNSTTQRGKEDAVFHVVDALTDDEFLTRTCSLTLLARKARLVSLLEGAPRCVRLVEGNLLPKERLALESLAFERGAIVKMPGVGYGFSGAATWFRYRPLLTTEVVVEEYEEGLLDEVNQQSYSDPSVIPDELYATAVLEESIHTVTVRHSRALTLVRDFEPEARAQLLLVKEDLAGKAIVKVAYSSIGEDGKLFDARVLELVGFKD